MPAHSPLIANVPPLRATWKEHAMPAAGPAGRFQPPVLAWVKAA